MNSNQNQFSKNPVLKWTPALLMMLAIFSFSAHSTLNMQLSLIERIVYKAGHVIGYAMLALTYWRAFEFRGGRQWLAWLLAILYAVTDEYHQSFVPGRHPTAFDVLVYDNAGALISLWLAGRWLKQKQPVPDELVMQRETHKPNR